MAERAGLSRREWELVERWHDENRSFLLFEEIAARVGARAKRVAFELVRKKVLKRVGRGRYLLVQGARSPFAESLASPGVVARTLAGVDHYFGGAWALWIHDFVEESTPPPIDVFVRARHGWRMQARGDVRYHVDGSQRPDCGVELTVIDGAQVRVTDRARTLLDLLDAPRAFPHVVSPVRLFEELLGSGTEAERLIQYATQRGRPSTCQRLGEVLSRRQLAWKSLVHFQEHVARISRSYVPLHPERTRKGRLIYDWFVIDNEEAPLTARGTARSEAAKALEDGALRSDLVPPPAPKADEDFLFPWQHQYVAQPSEMSPKSDRGEGAQ